MGAGGNAREVENGACLRVDWEPRVDFVKRWKCFERERRANNQRYCSQRPVF